MNTSQIVIRLLSTVLLATVLLLLGTVLSSGDLRGDEPNPRQSAQRLVAQLGHEQFAVRERASVKLISLGIEGVKALQAGKASPDREVRYRCTKLFSLIAEADVQERLEAFEQSDDPSQGYGLPGWERFREQVGTDEDARALFLTMQQEEWELMATLSRTSQLNRDVSRRCDAILAGLHDTSVASTSALLFLASDERMKRSSAVRHAVYQSCRQDEFLSAVERSRLRAPLVKLIYSWMKLDVGQDSWSAIYLGLICGVPETLVHASDVLRNRESVPEERETALLCFAKFGTKKDLALVESWLDDTTVCGRARRLDSIIDTEVRDVALATLVRLTKQNFAEYGFEHLLAHRYAVFYPESLGFADPEKRSQAMAMWHRYRRQSAE